MPPILKLNSANMDIDLATYVGGRQKLLPYRLGSHDLQFIEGDWVYHDSYLGENDFIGEEAVYHKGKGVWAMNCFGRILVPEKITSAQAGTMIKASLARMYGEGRFLGGSVHSEDELTPMPVKATSFSSQAVNTSAGIRKWSTNWSIMAGWPCNQSLQTSCTLMVIFICTCSISHTAT
jgi:hypothetical protein